MDNITMSWPYAQDTAREGIFSAFTDDSERPYSPETGEIRCFDGSVITIPAGLKPDEFGVVWLDPWQAVEYGLTKGAEIKEVISVDNFFEIVVSEHLHDDGLHYVTNVEIKAEEKVVKTLNIWSNWLPRNFRISRGCIEYKVGEPGETRAYALPDPYGPE